MNLFPNIIDVLNSAGVSSGKTHDFNLSLIALGTHPEWLKFNQYLGTNPQAAIRAHYEALNAKNAWTPRGDADPIPVIPIPTSILCMPAQFDGMMTNLVKQLQIGWAETPQVKHAAENAPLIYALAYAVSATLDGTLEVISVAAAIQAISEHEDSETVEDLVYYLKESSIHTSTLCSILKALNRSPNDRVQFRHFDEGGLDYEDICNLYRILNATRTARAIWQTT